MQTAIRSCYHQFQEELPAIRTPLVITGARIAVVYMYEPVTTAASSAVVVYMSGC